MSSDRQQTLIALQRWLKTEEGEKFIEEMESEFSGPIFDPDELVMARNAVQHDVITYIKELRDGTYILEA